MFNLEKSRNIIYNKLPNNSYGEFGIMLLEELYKIMGIDTYHNEFISVDNNKYTFFKHRDNFYRILPERYLTMHVNIMEENDGKIAREYINPEELYNINTIKKSFEMDCDEEKAVELKQKFYSMYGINAITASKIDIENDWELLLSYDKNNRLQFLAKSDKEDFCNLNSLPQCFNSNKEKLSFLKKVSKLEKRELNCFVNMVNSDYEIAQPVIEKICSIDPEEVVKEVERTRNIEMPKLCSYWFIAYINKNIDKLNEMLFGSEKHYNR